jgi:hypothetical protein
MQGPAGTGFTADDDDGRLRPGSSIACGGSQPLIRSGGSHS